MAKVITRKCMEPGCDERVRVRTNRKKVEKKGGVLITYTFARCPEHDEQYRKGELDDNKRRSSDTGGSVGQLNAVSRIIKKQRRQSRKVSRKRKV